MAYHDWHVGMKVVCVKEGAWLPDGEDNGFPKPKYGEVCTISHLSPDMGTLFIACEGYYPLDLYWANHFRPLVKRDADISIFTAMLNPQKQGVDA